MVNPRWARYITASINRYYEANKGTYTLWFEGLTLLDGTKVELRINGPTISERLFNQFHFELELNLFITVVPTSQIYDPEDMIGYFQSLAHKDILIYKLGSGPGEWNGVGDGAAFVLGCLRTRKDVPRPVDVIRWGKTDPKTDMFVASIDGYYEMELIL